MKELNESCIFPECPECQEGYLLPFSYKELYTICNIKSIILYHLLFFV